MYLKLISTTDKLSLIVIETETKIKWHCTDIGKESVPNSLHAILVSIWASVSELSVSGSMNEP